MDVVRGVTCPNLSELRLSMCESSDRIHYKFEAANFDPITQSVTDLSSGGLTGTNGNSASSDAFDAVL